MRAVNLLSSLAVALLAVSACRQVTVRGPDGQEVTATTPRAITIHRGETIPLTVGISRERFTGPVTVAITQLPKGVVADRSSQTVETPDATFSLVASNDADLVANQAVGVTVDAMDGRRATQFVALTVAE